tara:strand:+ start:1717 stop:1998 length:282 start_codon:yes stop_codon:yes gene_type:complete
MTFRVVRFTRGGAAFHCELALCIPQIDGLTEVIYGDRTDVCATHELSQAHHVNVETMLKKASVLAAVVRGAPALRANLPDYQDVRRTPHQSRA